MSELIELLLSLIGYSCEQFFVVIFGVLDLSVRVLNCIGIFSKQHNIGRRDRLFSPRPDPPPNEGAVLFLEFTLYPQERGFNIVNLI